MDKMHVKVVIIALSMTLLILIHRLYIRWRFNSRKALMRDLALKNQWNYTCEKTGVDDVLRQSRLMINLQDFRFQSVIEPPTDELKIWISDFYPAIGNVMAGGKDAIKYYYISRTIFVLEDLQLKLPHFFLRPEAAVADKLNKVLGEQDIDFTNDPNFSQAFIIQGKDEKQTRDLFDYKVRNSLVYYARDGIMIEGLGKFILIYQDRLQKIDQIAPLLLKLKEINKIFRSRNYIPETEEKELIKK